jgi:hypothetical protein
LSNVCGSFVKVRFGEQLIHKTKIIRHKWDKLQHLHLSFS